MAGIPVTKVSAKLELTDALRRQFPNTPIIDLAFEDLTNVGDISGQAGKFVVVNSLGTALAFVDAPSGGGGGGTSITKVDVVSSLPTAPATGVEAVFLTQADGSNPIGFYLWQAGAWSRVDLGGEDNVQSNWNEINSSSDAFIQNKPTIPVKASESEVTAGTNDSNFVTPLRLQEKLDALNPTPTHTTISLNQGYLADPNANLGGTSFDVQVGQSSSFTRPALNQDNQHWVIDVPTGYEITRIVDEHFPNISFLSQFTNVGQRWYYTNTLTNPSPAGQYQITVEAR